MAREEGRAGMDRKKAETVRMSVQEQGGKRQQAGMTHAAAGTAGGHPAARDLTDG